ncbi:MAG: hypothetical protein L0Y72_23690 [Gemmataceae bacterium]|nr:hypothetical protein [Gemmataceae bacterium]MCI0742047.1 hypothetical protein [Gemmataceae bacterium]
MHNNPTNSKQQPETEWHGELQKFCGPALLPDDANLEPRVRRGRPADTKRDSTAEKDAGNEQNKQSE